MASLCYTINLTAGLILQKLPLWNRYWKFYVVRDYFCTGKAQAQPGGLLLPGSCPLSPQPRALTALTGLCSPTHFFSCSQFHDCAANLPRASAVLKAGYSLVLAHRRGTLCRIALAFPVTDPAMKWALRVSIRILCSRVHTCACARGVAKAPHGEHYDMRMRAGLEVGLRGSHWPSLCVAGGSVPGTVPGSWASAPHGVGSGCALLRFSGIPKRPPGLPAPPPLAA